MWERIWLKASGFSLCLFFFSPFTRVLYICFTINICISEPELTEQALTMVCLVSGSLFPSWVCFFPSVLDLTGCQVRVCLLSPLLLCHPHKKLIGWIHQDSENICLHKHAFKAIASSFSFACWNSGASLQLILWASQCVASPDTAVVFEGREKSPAVAIIQ